MKHIYLLAADADAPDASVIRQMLTERGFAVRQEPFGNVMPSAGAHEVTLGIWSRNVPASPFAAQFESQAMSAMLEARLILASLDETPLPNSLGHMNLVDVSAGDERHRAIADIGEATVRALRNHNPAVELMRRSARAGTKTSRSRYAAVSDMLRKSDTDGTGLNRSIGAMTAWFGLAIVIGLLGGTALAQWAAVRDPDAGALRTLVFLAAGASLTTGLAGLILRPWRRG